MAQQPMPPVGLISKTSDNTLSAQPGTGLQIGSASLGWSDVGHWWTPAPSYPTANYIYSYTTPTLNPTEKAFRIVSAMMEKGIVGDLSVKEFVALVNDVAEIVRKN